jgi:CRISPR-associated protein Csy2
MTLPQFDQLMVLPHLRIQNANAISSPLTHGFPSITAFLGCMWALERKCRSVGIPISFKAVGVVCHAHEEQVTEDRFVRSFRLTRNPVGKDGGSAAIVEEGRIHLDLSLLFAVQCERWLSEPDSRDEDIRKIATLLSGMRIAGGTLIPPADAWRRKYLPYAIDLTGTADDQQQIFKKARMRLLPGFTLVSRDDLVPQRLKEMQGKDDQPTPLGAWLSLCRINWHYETPKEDTAEARRKAWKHDRAGRGWIVPIPVGYGALGELHNAGSIPNTRDASTPFRFVESLFSMGEWISPHRLHSASQLLWYADSQTEQGLYRCRNEFQAQTDASDIEFDFS